MRFETSIQIDAPAARVWDVMIDVERWPEWTTSVSSLRRLDAAPFGPGSRVRIKQPRLPPSELHVTRFDPGREFVWTAANLGLRVDASHAIAPVGSGVLVTLGVRFHGPVGLIVALLTRRLTTRYIRLEAEGLKRRSEDGA